MGEVIIRDNWRSYIEWWVDDEHYEIDLAELAEALKPFLKERSDEEREYGK